MGKKNGWQVETINLVTLFGWLNCMHCQLLNPDTEVFGLYTLSYVFVHLFHYGTH